MTSSELEVEIDLKKAPPHVEGELLKQSTKALGYKSWKKYFFIVIKDKLQYFSKREDSKQSKEPIAFIRMSQVTGITEVIFSGVPKKHHLNCGFSVEAFHPVSQQQITLNLLTETPEDMRYWVHALRYIKGYWSKMMIRETVLNEEQERKILERILTGDTEEGDNSDDELLRGDYSIDEDSLLGSQSMDDLSCPVGSGVTVYFADGSKVKLSLKSTETTSDLLDKEEVKEYMTSSTAHVWLVDSLGNDMRMGSSDHPALFPGKTHKLFALDHVHRVLPVFYNKKEFECVIVNTAITTAQLLKDHDLSVRLDLIGVTNRGLFLKSDAEELLFTDVECPCDVLFDTDDSGNPSRQPVGKLVVHNRTLGGGRAMYSTTRRLRTKRTIYKTQRNPSEENYMLKEKSEEEEAQSKALDMVIGMRKKIVPDYKMAAARPVSHIEVEVDGDWVVANKSSSSSKRPDSTGSPRDSRGLEDVVVMENSSPGRKSTSPAIFEQRDRSVAISDTLSHKRGSLSSGSGNKLKKSPPLSPNSSPRKSRSRSKSPHSKQLPSVPPQRYPSPSHDSEGGLGPTSSPLQRRNATRGGSTVLKENPRRSPSVKSNPETSTSFSNLEQNTMDKKPFHSQMGKGPMIRFPDNEPEASSVQFPDQLKRGSSLVPRDSSPPRITRTRSPTVRGTYVDTVNIDVAHSRSSAFGLASPVETSERSLRSDSDASSLAPSSAANKSQTPPTTGQGDQLSKEAEQSPVTLSPFIIDFKALQIPQPQLPTMAKDTNEESKTSVTTTEGKPLPIKVTSPNLLKIILLQSSEAREVTMETKPMDFISLSGVVLFNHRGVWSIQEGYNYHDGLPFDSEDHTETFCLSGGIRAIYNHTHKRWHVLPPSTSTPSGDDSHSMVDSIEHAQNDTEQNDGTNAQNNLYLSKKVVITEIGSSFHDIINLFGQTRDLGEKKKIGSDMTNPAIGHMVRGRFCSAIARLLLDGLRPYRLQGILQDDIWKVTMAFCSAAQSDPTSSLVTPAIDKLIFQPINALKTVMKDNNIKFRTFICLAMSKGMLIGWLEALPKQKSVLQKYYLPTAFLSLVAGGDPYHKLYQEMLLTLEPMVYLPFDLSIDFESRQMIAAEKHQGKKVGVVNGSAESAVKEGVGSDGLSPSVPNSSMESSPSQNSLRPNVVIKTHAATGQRSAAGNVLNAVWDTSPLHNHGNATATVAGPSDEIDGGGNKEGVQTGVLLEERVVEKKEVFNKTKHQEVKPRGIKKLKGTIFKKLSEGFQQLNMGGALTGAPPTAPPPPPPSTDVRSNRPHPQAQPQQQTNLTPATGQRTVEALYTNICDDTDELCFTKGDFLVVKEQINSEWLICSLGNKTGIVPVNYIKPVS